MKRNFSMTRFAKILDKEKTVRYEIQRERIAFTDKHGTIGIITDGPNSILSEFRSRGIQAAPFKGLFDLLNRYVNDTDTTIVSDTKITLPARCDGIYRTVNVLQASSGDKFVFVDHRKYQVVIDPAMIETGKGAQSLLFVCSTCYAVIIPVAIAEDDVRHILNSLVELTAHLEGRLVELQQLEEGDTNPCSGEVHTHSDDQTNHTAAG